MLDKAVLGFLLYNLFLLILSFTRGGTLVIGQHFHNYITGILIYFVIRGVMTNENQLEFTINLYIASASLVALLFIAEWIAVNSFEMAPLSWQRTFQEETGTDMVMFWSRQGLEAIRVAGVLGHTHATALYVAGAALASLGKILMKAKLFVFNVISLIATGTALMLSGARTSLIAFVLVGFLLIVYGIKKGIFRIRVRRWPLLLLLVLIIAALGMQFWKPYRASFARLYGGGYFANNESGLAEDAEKAHELFLQRIWWSGVNGYLAFVREHRWALLTGFGFYSKHLGPEANPLISEESFFFQLLSTYGLLGVFVTLRAMMCVRKILRQTVMWNKRIWLGKPPINLSVIAAGIVCLFLLTVIHSGAILRYGIYYWMFVFLAVIGASYSFAAAKYSLRCHPGHQNVLRLEGGRSQEVN
ncbi:MAG: hypothetical protein HY747_02015 [Elusimicrobia bacterium]|nr:hypothetical protein [Elusimicrobiota bacterium]